MVVFYSSSNLLIELVIGYVYKFISFTGENMEKADEKIKLTELVKLHG
ncbi:hypothetical protein ACO3VM_02350 [Methanocaldococcus sp. 10A]